MIDLRCHRRPHFVLAPLAMRQMVRSLIDYDERPRETLSRQALWLASAPESRVRKCLQYAEDPVTSWMIYQIALKHLLKKVNLSIMHPSDVDSTIELFTTLRDYTFEVPLDKLSQLLSKGTFEGMIVSDRTRKEILSIASKISRGITPRKSTKGGSWNPDIIDDWLEQVERLAATPG